MIKQQPLLSFVLPAYKAQFLKEAIASILSQTYQNFELVIVDDASPEDLESIVSEFNDIRVRYYRNEQNIGGTDLVKQWNHCLTFATGDYVILAADDDVYDKEFLAEAERLFKKYPNVPVKRNQPRILFFLCTKQSAAISRGTPTTSVTKSCAIACDAMDTESRAYKPI